MQDTFLRAARHLTGMALLLMLGSAFALQSDRNQPINVVSSEQIADLQANLISFIGNVEATQGSMKILADKIDVTRNTDGSLRDITAYGKPVRFSQMPDKGKLINANSSVLKYTTNNNMLVLTGRAIITQGESRLTGERIEYNLNTQIMKANTSQMQGGRVSTTFIPSDVKVNNNGKRAQGAAP